MICAIGRTWWKVVTVLVVVMIRYEKLEQTNLRAFKKLLNSNVRGVKTILYAGA